MTSNVIYTTQTENEKKEHKILWKFPNFKDVLHNSVPGTEIFAETDDFTEDTTKSRIQLKMQIISNQKNFITFHYLSPINAFLKCDLLVITKFISCYGSERLVDITYQSVLANKWQYLFMCPVTEISKYFHNNQCLELCFLFICDLKVLKPEVPDAQLGGDFENVLNSGLFADAIIKSAEGKEYKVHKLVLASRSEVMKAFFVHDNIQSSTNILESPFESEVLSEVLIFIYSDKAPRVQEITNKLLVAADFYQLNNLKNLCTEALQKQLTADNVMEVLHLADKHSASLLKLLALEFITKHDHNPIIKSDGWKKCESFDLLKDIFEHYCRNR